MWDDDTLLAIFLMSGGLKWILAAILGIGSAVAICVMPIFGIPLAALGVFLFVKGYKSEKLSSIAIYFALALIVAILNCVVGFYYI